MSLRTLFFWAITPLTITLGCTPSGAQRVDELSAWGPFSVGYTESEVVYTRADTDGSRGLRLATWYPSEDVSGVSLKYLDLFNAPNVWDNATVAEGDFPMVVYSHGHQGYAEASSHLMSFFASHGYVVAAPDHTGNTTFDGSSRDTSVYYLRMMDISAVIDFMVEQGPAPVTDHITGIGHSFGGYTMLGLAGAVFDVDGIQGRCEKGEGGPICSDWSTNAAEIFRQGLGDPRLDAVVAMASGDADKFGVEGLTQTETPILMMDGSLDPATGGSSEPIWSGLQGRDNVRVHIEGGGHQTFTDMSGILETFDGLIDPETGDTIVNVYSMAFTKQLAGEKGYGSIVNGDAVVSDAVVLSQ